LHELQAMTRLALERADNDGARSLQELLARLGHLCQIDADIDAVALRRQVQQQIRNALSPQST
jgi:hypothetical protein